MRSVSVARARAFTPAAASVVSVAATGRDIGVGVCAARWRARAMLIVSTSPRTASTAISTAGTIGAFLVPDGVHIAFPCPLLLPSHAALFSGSLRLRLFLYELELLGLEQFLGNAGFIGLRAET